MLDTTNRAAELIASKIGVPSVSISAPYIKKSTQPKTLDQEDITTWDIKVLGTTVLLLLANKNLFRVQKLNGTFYKELPLPLSPKAIGKAIKCCDAILKPQYYQEQKGLQCVFLQQELISRNLGVAAEANVDKGTVEVSIDTANSFTLTFNRHLRFHAEKPKGKRGTAICKQLQRMYNPQLSMHPPRLEKGDSITDKTFAMQIVDCINNRTKHLTETLSIKEEDQEIDLF